MVSNFLSKFPVEQMVQIKIENEPGTYYGCVGQVRKNIRYRKLYVVKAIIDYNELQLLCKRRDPSFDEN